MGLSKRRRHKIKRRVHKLLKSHSLDTWSRRHHRRASKLKKAIKYGQPSWFRDWSPSASLRLCEREISKKFRKKLGLVRPPPGRPLSAVTAINERYVGKITRSHPTYSVSEATDRLKDRVRSIYDLVYLYWLYVCCTVPHHHQSQLSIQNDAGSQSQASGARAEDS